MTPVSRRAPGLDWPGRAASQRLNPTVTLPPFQSRLARPPGHIVDAVPDGFPVDGERRRWDLAGRQGALGVSRAGVAAVKNCMRFPPSRKKKHGICISNHHPPASRVCAPSTALPPPSPANNWSSSAAQPPLASHSLAPREFSGQIPTIHERSSIPGLHLTPNSVLGCPVPSCLPVHKKASSSTQLLVLHTVVDSLHIVLHLVPGPPLHLTPLAPPSTVNCLPAGDTLFAFRRFTSLTLATSASALCPVCPVLCAQGCLLLLRASSPLSSQDKTLEPPPVCLAHDSFIIDKGNQPPFSPAVACRFLGPLFSLPSPVTTHGLTFASSTAHHLLPASRFSFRPTTQTQNLSTHLGHCIFLSLATRRALHICQA